MPRGYSQPANEFHLRSSRERTPPRATPCSSSERTPPRATPCREVQGWSAPAIDYADSGAGLYINMVVKPNSWMTVGTYLVALLLVSLYIRCFYVKLCAPIVISAYSSRA